MRATAELSPTLFCLFILPQKQAQANVCLTTEMVKEALDQLRGAVMIVYPMGLPPHDPIQMEFEDQEDLSGTQVIRSCIIISFSSCFSYYLVQLGCLLLFRTSSSLLLCFFIRHIFHLPSGLPAGDHRGRVSVMVGGQRTAEGEKTAGLCRQK